MDTITRLEETMNQVTKCVEGSNLPSSSSLTTVKDNNNDQKLIQKPSVSTTHEPNRSQEPKLMTNNNTPKRNKIKKHTENIDQSVESSEDIASEDECIYLGATHFINLLSSEEDDDSCPALMNIMSETEKKQYELPPLAKIVIDEIEVSDDEQENEEINKLNEKSQENKENQGEEAITNSEIANILNSNLNKDEIGEYHLNFKQEEISKELEIQIDEELKKQDNDDLNTNLFETENLNNINLPEVINFDEILPELDFNVCRESNLNDVKAMERELDNVLNNIDAEAQVASEDLNKVGDIKQQPTTNLEKTLKVVWSSNSSFEKNNFNCENTVSMFDDVENCQFENAQENVMDKIVWSQSNGSEQNLVTSNIIPTAENEVNENRNLKMENGSQNLHTVEKDLPSVPQMSNITPTVVVAESLTINQPKTENNSCIALISKEAIESTKKELDLSSDTSNSGSSDDEDDDSDSGSDSESDSSDDSSSDESSIKLESEVESGELRDDTDDEGNETKTKDESSPKKAKVGV